MPILYAQLGSTQKAVDYVMGTIRDTIRDFDAAAEKVKARYSSEDEKTVKDVDDFILGCRYYCTGNLSWR